MPVTLQTHLCYTSKRVYTATLVVVTAMKIRVLVFWVVTPFSVVVGYQRVGWEPLVPIG